MFNPDSSVTLESGHLSPGRMKEFQVCPGLIRTQISESSIYAGSACKRGAGRGRHWQPARVDDRLDGPAQRPAGWAHPRPGALRRGNGGSRRRSGPPGQPSPLLLAPRVEMLHIAIVTHICLYNANVAAGLDPRRGSPAALNPARGDSDSGTGESDPDVTPAPGGTGRRPRAPACPREGLSSRQAVGPGFARLNPSRMQVRGSGQVRGPRCQIRVESESMHRHRFRGSRGQALREQRIRGRRSRAPSPSRTAAAHSLSPCGPCLGASRWKTPGRERRGLRVGRILRLLRCPSVAGESPGFGGAPPKPASPIPGIPKPGSPIPGGIGIPEPLGSLGLGAIGIPKPIRIPIAPKFSSQPPAILRRSLCSLRTIFRPLNPSQSKEPCRGGGKGRGATGAGRGGARRGGLFPGPAI